jgi:small-conductance mechanosensitive channel
LHGGPLRSAFFANQFKPVNLMNAAFQTVETKLNGWVIGFFSLLPNLFAALIVGLLFIGLAFGMAHVLRRALIRAHRHDLGHVLASFAFWAVTFFGFLVVITIILPSMQPVDIFTSLGVGSVAVGFAFKDILQNWLAGVFILIRRPFHRGDQIKLGDIEGTVQAVETRATLVKTYSGRLVIIPNTEIYTKSLTVHTAYDIRRSEIVVPVGLEVDLDVAMETFRNAATSVEDVLADPPPDVLPWEFKDNNVNLRIRWWTKSQRSYEVRTRAGIVLAVKRMSEDAGIALPSDTKISFAETPLVVAPQPKSAKTKKPLKAAGSATKAKVQKTKVQESPAKTSATAAKEALPDPDDDRHDPEAEKPKAGELNEGLETIPR